MSGFLDKKSRLIDYKLTNFGQSKIAKGNLNFQYYTFSDSEIVYSEDSEIKSDFKISNSEKFYFPFEVEISGQNLINPEYKLDRIINYDNLEENVLNKSIDLNYTITQYLKETMFLDNFKVKSKLKEENINFVFLDEKDDFDFNNILLEYPTIKYNTEDLSNLEIIQNDRRFLHKIKNKTLPIKEQNSQNLRTVNTINDIFYIFKHFDTNNYKISNNRNESIINVLKDLKNNNKIYKMEYEINALNINDEDVYLFELHEINDNVLNKLTFIDLGEIFDKSTETVKSIYLIGKVLLNSPNIDRQSKLRINIDYSFVNMFILVAE